MLRGCRKKQCFCTLLVECKLVQQKAIRRFFKKLQTDLPYDPVIPFLGIYLKEHKQVYNTSTCTSMFIAAYSQKSSSGNSSEDLLLMNEFTKCGIYMQ
jgi:hypothetical protein